MTDSISGGWLGGTENAVRSTAEYARIWHDSWIDSRNAWAVHGSFHGVRPEDLHSKSVSVVLLDLRQVPYSAEQISDGENLLARGRDGNMMACREGVAICPDRYNPLRLRPCPHGAPPPLHLTKQDAERPSARPGGADDIQHVMERLHQSRQAGVAVGPFIVLADASAGRS